MNLAIYQIVKPIAKSLLTTKVRFLAAGLGTRLRPLTDTTPKCLMPINGKPLLEIWCEFLLSAGVTRLLINLHHKSDLVQQHISKSKFANSARQFLNHNCSSPLAHLTPTSNSLKTMMAFCYMLITIVKPTSNN